jgi:hypothetical protein
MPTMEPSGEAELVAWLTTVLRAGESLPSGRVVAVASGANGAFNSAVSHLRLTYSSDAPASAPRRLLLKRSLPSEWGMRMASVEVAFYREIATLAARPDAAGRLPMIVPCHAAEYDAERQSSSLLLEDVSQTHYPPLTRDQQLTPGANVPAPRDLDRVVTTLARFHAYWWGHPLLCGGEGALGSWYPTRDDIAAMIARREAALARLLAREDGDLPMELRQLVERVIAALPDRWDRHVAPRLRDRRQITLVHGDAYFANFLTPVDPASDAPTYLIDWQGPEANLGAQDLVNMIATFWTSEQRHEGGREMRALRRYHETLQAYGVSGYSWDDLLFDYRFAVLDWLLVPIQDAGDGSRHDYWWPKLHCLAAAYRDLGCEGLLAA